MNYAVRLVITDIDSMREVRAQTLTLTGTDLDEAKRRYDLIEGAQPRFVERVYAEGREPGEHPGYSVGLGEMSDLMSDQDRYDELAVAARRVIRTWETSELSAAVNELRETLEAHGTDEEDPDVLVQEEMLRSGQSVLGPR